MPSHFRVSASEHDSLRLPFPRLAESSFYAGGHGIGCLTDEALYEACSTRIAFTMRKGGVSKGPYASLNLASSVPDDPSAVLKNRELVCDALGSIDGASSLIVPKQVHGTNIVDIEGSPRDLENVQQGADSVVCTSANVPVLLCFADCVPVILVAPDGSFSVVHSGWRGTIASIAGLSLSALVNATSCLPSEVNCYIGPHIHSCCYEVGEDLIEDFISEFGPSCRARSSHLDLCEAVRISLVRAGADEKRIISASYCTSCNIELFYSHRAENGNTGRHGAFALRKEEP